jgi:hypothetical protein
MVAEQRMKYQSAAYHTRLEPDHQKIVQESENSATKAFPLYFARASFDKSMLS